MEVPRFLRAAAMIAALGIGGPALVRAQAASVSAKAAAPASTAGSALEARLREIAAAHHGKVALYATQLNTGRTVALDPDAVVQTASVIKLTILFEAMEQVRAGKAHWDDKIVLQPGDAVSGSGVL
ncbi:MAG TPA: serine hydrolase, partial [Acidobacteriaceae bacterium]|nr:serine hydrolase [Acidobacteriaceae bacterium]